MSLCPTHKKIGFNYIKLRKVWSYYRGNQMPWIGEREKSQ